MSTTRSIGLAGLAVLGVGTFAGCGGGSSGDSAPDAAYSCEIEMRDDPFVAGMTKTSHDGTMAVSILDGNPAPPSKGNNAWTIHLADGSGPITGATITLDNYMPEHAHHAVIKPVITESTTTPGDYALEPVNFFMPGLWESTFSVTRATTTTPDTTLFKFCINR